MRFLTAHSSSSHWPQALQELAEQVARERARADTITRPNLGLLYVDARHAAWGEGMLQDLREQLGVAHWVGGFAPGVFASGASGADPIEPCGVAVMLAQFAVRDFRVFSGRQPLAPASSAWRGAHAALVHADAEQPELDELVAELGQRCSGGDAWGGILSPVAGAQVADAVLRGGLSGVAFSSRVPLLGGLSQGLEPVGPERTVTRCADNVVYALDGEPALEALLDDLGEPRRAREREQWRDLVPSLREVVVGLSRPRQAQGVGQDAGSVMRGLIGIDPGGQGVALAADLEPGMRLRFCRRQRDTGLRDLLRLCTEVRDEAEQRRDALLEAGHRRPGRQAATMRGGVFVTCAARGAQALRSELQLLRAQLGGLPLVGFRAAGEFSGAAVHAYASVLRVFGQDPAT